MQKNLLFKCLLLFTLLGLSACYQKPISTQPSKEQEPTEVIDSANSPAAEAPEDETESIEAATEKVETEKVETEEIETKEVEFVESEAVDPDSQGVETVKPETVVPEKTETKKIETDSVDVVVSEAQQDKPQKTFSLSGRVVLDQSKIKEKTAKLEHAFVYFEPKNLADLALPTNNAVISTRNKQFIPDVLAITKGSQVSFPNMDRILHNVFSVSPNSEFDLGLYSAGTAKDVVFDEPGVIYVHCNVHHSMQADILVLDTPYFVQVDAQGNFQLNDLPELEGTLKTWHPRANIQSLAIDANTNPTEITKQVLVTRPEVPKHSNKFGHPYRRKRY